jgi:alkanesulfonate monooxygenase SsuD/methylene tetrahydromethanopterin reductase-like flavin-dependent oxidoreductase (luciferase family)
MEPKPALSLAAMRGKRRAALEMARTIEREGFAGIYCPSFGDGLGLCTAIALVTKNIPFGTAIANIYTRHPHDYALTVTMLHELAPGRFRFGIGVSHGPVLQRLGIQPGKPVADVERFVGALREGAERWGELPPIVLASLRPPMIRLAARIASGAIWANACRSHMRQSLTYLGERATDPDFFVGNMIPTCIDEDPAAAAQVLRKTLVGYVMLPNYQRYWMEAGYVEEMQAIQKALAAREYDRVPALMSDRWLRDCTLFGSPAEVREGVEAWRAAGVKTPILVPSSTRGGQFQALEEVIAAFR